MLDYAEHIEKLKYRPRVCSKHFCDSSYDIKKVLKEDAIPDAAPQEDAEVEGETNEPHKPTLFRPIEVHSRTDIATQTEKGETLPNNNERATQTPQILENTPRKRKLKNEANLDSSEMKASRKDPGYALRPSPPRASAASFLPSPVSMKQSVKLETQAVGEATSLDSCELVSGEFQVKTHSGCTFPETNAFTLDREVLMDLHTLSDKIQNFYPALQGKPFTVTFKGTDEDKSEYVFSSSSRSRRQGEPHIGVKCSKCLADVIGFRYKCVSCPDYNLCGACEALGVHEQHMMMRISRPLKSKHARVLVQRWCKAMKSAGVATLDDLCEPAQAPMPSARIAAPPRDSAPGDPGFGRQVIRHRPIIIKEEPMDEDETETPSTSRTTKKCKTRATKRSDQRGTDNEVATRKKVATTRIKKEIKAEISDEKSLVDYCEALDEADATVDINDVKLEIEDPLSSEIFLELQEQKHIPDCVSQNIAGQSDSALHVGSRCKNNRRFPAGRPVLVVDGGTVLGQTD